MKRYALLVFLSTLLFFNLSVLGGTDLREAFPELNTVLTANSVSLLENAASSEEGGINRFFTADGGRPEHIPSIPPAQDLLDAAYEIDFSIGVETIYLIPWTKVSDSIKNLSEDEFRLRIYNILRSVSTLEGIEYYSASREKMRTLFEECWAIDNPDTRNRIDDPLVQTVPPTDSIFIHQKDLTFGKNISRVNYQSSESQFRMGIVNLTTMTYMLFPIVGKENMSMQLLVVPTQEGILFYGLNTVKVLDLRIFYKKMESSFTNRMIALFNWFQAQLS